MSIPPSGGVPGKIMTQVTNMREPNKYGRLEDETAPAHVQVQFPMGTTTGYPSMQHPGAVQFATFTTSEEPVKWSWCNLVTAVFSVFCCQIFGVIAIVMSVLAYVDHKVKDYQRSRSKRNVAWGFAIAGLVIGIVAICVAIGLIFTVFYQVETASDSLNGLLAEANEDANNFDDMENNPFGKDGMKFPENMFGESDRD